MARRAQAAPTGPGIAVGAVASLATLVVFFHPWLAIGLAIDVGLLWAALVARWTPEVLAS